MSNVRVPVGASVDDIEHAAEQAGYLGAVVFEPGVYEIDRTLRLPELRHYNGNGCIIRAARVFDGPLIQLYEVPELWPKYNMFERVVRWIRVHILRQILWDTPGTMIQGFHLIGSGTGTGIRVSAGGGGRRE